MSGNVTFNDLPLEALQNVARFVGIRNIGTFSVINPTAAKAARNVYGPLKAEFAEIPSVDKGVQSPLRGEAQCIFTLRSFGWKVQRWEHASETSRSSLGLGNLKPDAIRIEVNGNTPVDFFTLGFSSGNPNETDAEKKKGQVAASVQSSLNSFLNNAGRKFQKYSGGSVKCVAVGDCSKLPQEFSSSIYFDQLQELVNAKKKGWKDLGELWWVRDLELRRLA